MQRLRVRFSRGEELKFIAHLDLMRTWERVLRRAGCDIAYSEGFTPHPRLSLASPLQVGATGSNELMDVWLERWVNPHEFMQNATRQLPTGLRILEVKLVSPDEPSLQSQVRLAEYVVKVEAAEGEDSIYRSLKDLLSATSLPWTHTRDREQRRYDLRELVKNIRLLSHKGNFYRLAMLLRCDTRGSGRPEQVTRALGFLGPPLSIERRNLYF